MMNVTPTFEYQETISVGVGNDSLPNVFKFLDKNNRIMALRPDMTTPIARVAATRLRESSLPLKLFYMTNVFRYDKHKLAASANSIRPEWSLWEPKDRKLTLK